MSMQLPALPEIGSATVPLFCTVNCPCPIPLTVSNSNWFGLMTQPAPHEELPPPLRILFLISISFVTLPTVPQFAVGAGLLLELPHCTAISTPPGKLVIVLLFSFACVTVAAV